MASLKVHHGLLNHARAPRSKMFKYARAAARFPNCFIARVLRSESFNSVGGRIVRVESFAAHRSGKEIYATKSAWVSLLYQPSPVPPLSRFHPIQDIQSRGAISQAHAETMRQTRKE